MKIPHYDIEYRKEASKYPEYEGGYPLRGVVNINVTSIGWIWDVGSHAYVRLRTQACLDAETIRGAE